MILVKRLATSYLVLFEEYLVCVPASAPSLPSPGYSDICTQEASEAWGSRLGV